MLMPGGRGPLAMAAPPPHGSLADGAGTDRRSVDGLPRGLGHPIVGGEQTQGIVPAAPRERVPPQRRLPAVDVGLELAPARGRGVLSP